MAPLKSFSELAFKKDKDLPNLKVPVKGKKGVSKYMRKAGIMPKKQYDSEFRQRMVASVQSADKKPEKYMKPDGKVGIRMVKTDKEVVKKESIDNHPKVKAARKAHAAGTWDGNVDKEGEAVVHINGKPHTVTNKFKAKNLRKETIVDPRDLRGRPKKPDPNPESKYGIKHPLHPANLAKKKKMKKMKEAINHDDAHRDAQQHSDGSMSVKKIPSMVKKPGDKHLHLHMKSYHKEKDGQDFAKKHGYKVKNYVKTPSGTRMDIHKEEVEVDEALTLQQRMKRSRLMKRLKTRIKIGRDRARRKMANKQKLEKRAMRQARAQIAKKLTRGIPKGELSFARKQEIEKRLEKPMLKQRIKRIAKRIFKDVRKKEVQRKKG